MSRLTSAPLSCYDLGLEIEFKDTMSEERVMDALKNECFLGMIIRFSDVIPYSP